MNVLLMLIGVLIVYLAIKLVFRVGPFKYWKSVNKVISNR